MFKNQLVIDLLKSNDPSNYQVAYNLMLNQGWEKDALDKYLSETMFDFINETFINVEQCLVDGNDAIKFYKSDNSGIMLCHIQDCCETVYVEDINGDLSDLIGEKIIQATEFVECGISKSGSYTYTFYKFATRKGYVTIRFNGNSDGYYSESVHVKTF